MRMKIMTKKTILQMETDTINRLNGIIDGKGQEYPEIKVKKEKKERGLYERTENSTILITEDNKFMLND